MQKNQKSPLDRDTERIVEGARRTQEEINKLGAGRKQPEFTKGTIEPTTKK